ncbi:MAG: LPS export ABC transporter periplasmic protein LptC [Magnetospiraceae bacterium]
MADTEDKPDAAPRDRLAFLQQGPQKAPLNVSGYARWTSNLKTALAAGAVMLVILVLAWPEISGKDTRIRLGGDPTEKSPQSLQDSADITVANARYLGTDENGRPFKVTAEVARNIGETASRVELTAPEANIELSDTSWVSAAAGKGLYDRETENLYLDGGVTVSNEAGYRVTTESAEIDLEAATAVGTAPVTGSGPLGDLSGEGFAIENGGRTLRLTGKSRVLIRVGDLK